MSGTHGFKSVEDTAKYYTDNFDMYRKVWGGTNDRMCWGFFDTMHSDIQLAGERHVERMASISGFTEESKVLDIGCGKGTTAFYIQDNFRPTSVALDPVKEFIDICNGKKEERGADKMTFLAGTLHDLDAQLEDGSFTHVWSNATLHHIPEPHRLETVHMMFRKLAPGGQLIFDDLMCRQQEDSELVRKNILERLHVEPLWTFDTWNKHLADAGFKLISSEDISSHMEHTYRTTTNNAAKHGYSETAAQHVETANACARGAAGWGIFRATKVA